MAPFALILLGISLGARADGSQGGSDVAANPIRKIVTLLQDMQKEIDAQGAKEKELYDKFMCFCDGGAEDLAKSAADAKATAETLTAQEAQDSAEKSSLEEDIQKHETDLAGAQADLEKATAIRGKEQSEFEAEYSDKKTNTESLSKAIISIEHGMSSSSLMQLDDGGVYTQIKEAMRSSTTVTPGEKDSVLAFLDASSSSSSRAPSDQIVGILKAMSDEMTKNMEDLQTTEDENAKGFVELKASKTKEIAIAKESIFNKKTRAGELAVAIVQAQDGIDDSTSEAANAEKFLATLDVQCKTKKEEWAERCKTRTEEISAISEAISILNADDALDVFKKTALVAKASRPVAGFLQAEASDMRRLKKVSSVIEAAVGMYKSQRLDLLQYNIDAQMRRYRRHTHKGKASSVDFGAIMKMIDNMVSVLTKEQADDESHKTWCNNELTKSEDESNAAKDKIEDLEASISELSDEISTAAEDIAQLQESISTLDKDVAEATVQRKEEHAEYLETAQLTKAAVELMGRAKNRLQKFYNPALYKAPPTTPAPASLLQIRAVHRHSKVAPPEAPETFGSTYGKSKKSSGVLELMTMLQHELEASLATAEHEEKTAQEEYQKLMVESQATREQDGKSLTNKGAMKADLEGKLSEAKENKYTSHKEQENIWGYISELHGSCDFILDNFSLRKEARGSELESLKNAKAILSGASYSA